MKTRCIYTIQASLYEEGKTYKVNRTFQVVADCAQDALQLVLKHSPNADIWQLNKTSNTYNTVILLGV